MGKHGKPVPARTLTWSITERGLGRLNFRGGHDQWCPRCQKKGGSR